MTALPVKIKVGHRKRAPTSPEHFIANLPDTSKEIVEYFEQRRKRLRVVKTTVTPSGQILDWVPIESQFPSGKIPTLPPVKSPPIRHLDKKFKRAGFELEDPSVDRGPKGTVPILRKDFSKIHVTGTLQRYLSKTGPDNRQLTGKKGARTSANPSPFGYFHGQYSQSFVGQSTNIAGASGYLNVWDPYVDDWSGFGQSGPTYWGHSLMQTALQNFDPPQSQSYPQSLEAGWTVDYGLNGDYEPHLFTYYTTNGYTQDGDDLGGYNQDVTGWVQLDPNIFPGALITGGSAQQNSADVPVTPPTSMQIQYQLIGGQWLLLVNGTTIGSYPANLFTGNQGPGLSLGDHADWVAFYGEVYSSLSNPNLTNTQMGSGCFADQGLFYAALAGYLSTIDKTGAFIDLVGTTQAEAPAMYDIIAYPYPGWTDDLGAGSGSAFYAGGPGAGPIFRSLVLNDNYGNGYALDGYGDIVNVGPNLLGGLFSMVNTISFLPSWNICRGIVEQSLETGCGYVLDGYGGVHPYGPAASDVPAGTNCTYWSWDIARAIVLIQGGIDAGESGYVLDGWGAIHPWWGQGAPVPPTVNLTAYWPGWDIFRSFVICDDWAGGYVLDGWGGIHAWGTAPPPNLTNAAYWQGWDIARGIALLPNGSSGYVLDGWGGIHPWGSPFPQNVTNYSYYTPGQDTATSIALTPNGTQGSVLDNVGGVHPFTIP